jgi:D-alanyl-D-alanine carboxypeptidase/D-alanyl-D-alanine-endopeptidase (penicillin-binding protein 4)
MKSLKKYKKWGIVATSLVVILVPLVLIADAPSNSGAVTNLFTGVAKSYNMTPGEQSFCAVTATGTVAEYNAKKTVVPASISKLFTFDFALNTLGKDFRYTTDFYIVGTTLFINGGGDPHFVISNLRSVIKKISEDERVVISRFVFSPNFYFNWQDKPKDVIKALTTSLKENPGAVINPKFTVQSAKRFYTDGGIHYQFQSAPLSILVKQINNYSTNFSADTLFERAGGHTAFQKYMQSVYGATTADANFYTGSGLSKNTTNCNMVLQVLKHLESTAGRLEMRIENLMSIPRVDPGPLNDALMSMATTSGIVAKSGYIDFHHNLAGIASTTEGPVYFAVFGVYKNKKDDKKNQQFIEDFISQFLGRYVQIPFDYAPRNNQEVIDAGLVLKVQI